MGYPLLSQKVADFDGFVAIGDGGVDGKVSIHEPHLVAVPLGDAGDEVLDVAEGGADGGAGFPGAEPGFDPELALSLLIGDELEIQVQVLEVAGKLASGSLHLDDLGVNLDFHPVGDVHRLRRQYGLHLCSLSLSHSPWDRAAMRKMKHSNIRDCRDGQKP